MFNRHFWHFTSVSNEKVAILWEKNDAFNSRQTSLSPFTKPLAHLSSISTEGVESIEQAFLGLRCLSGLGSKSLISTVDETLGFWQRESKLKVREADEARRLLSARRDENELSDIVEFLLWLSTCTLGLCGSSFSIGFWREKTCFRDVSERFVRSRFLCTGTMSIISGVGSNVTEACDPCAESCLSGLVSSTEIAWRCSRNMPGCRYPFSRDSLCTILPCLPWWCFEVRRPGEASNNGLLAFPFSTRFGTEPLLEILRSFDAVVGGTSLGDLQTKENEVLIWFA